MSSQMNDAWFEAQPDHNLACAKYGDCIFDEVKAGAQELHSRWKYLGRLQDPLIDKAVQGPLFGLFPSIFSRDWLETVIFDRRSWPKELTKEERDLLRIALAVSQYHPQYEKGINLAKAPQVSDDIILVALQKYIALFKRQVALPMWKAYLETAKKYGARIAPLCKAKYDEPCTEQEGTNIFEGDMQRGWRMNSLDWDRSSQKVFPEFFNWISK